jgi:hypothetical protein
VSSTPLNSVAVPGSLQNSFTLHDHDRLILRHVDESISKAIQVKQWWEAKRKEGFADQFPLIKSFGRFNEGTGFFDSATIAGKTVELMGVVQQMLFDRPDTGSASILPTIGEELQEFVIQYFMRVSRGPGLAVDISGEADSRDRSLLSWCPRGDPDWQGFGYSQLYYKLKQSGAIGKFAEKDWPVIIDLRELGKTYDWIVVKVRIYDFNLTFHPFGPNLPAISAPLREETYLVLSKDFILYNQYASEQFFSEYGVGYGLLCIESPPSVQAYGPGHFKVGFQTIYFRMLPDGQINAELVFVVNRPERLVNFPVDPFQWGFALADLATLGLASRPIISLARTFQSFLPSFGTFDPILTYVALANFLTGGAAAKQLCISKKQLEKEMLIQHFIQHYQLMVGSLLTWRQIPSWLQKDKADLPDWVVRGTSQ